MANGTVRRPLTPKSQHHGYDAYISAGKSWIPVLTFVVAIASLSLNYCENSAKVLENEVHSWDMAIVYKIIVEENGATFQRIQERYIQETLKAMHVRIHPAHLQDDVLSKTLLDLLTARLIVVGSDRVYRVSYSKLPRCSRR